MADAIKKKYPMHDPRTSKLPDPQMAILTLRGDKRNEDNIHPFVKLPYPWQGMPLYMFSGCIECGVSDK
jgi:hypothetical protein